ncbi:MAG: LLM class flavin-dependent oxidoreductase [Immundisolibacteraceae bacterium]|nr:LLM class flavin-dependent oxidoreductase [Immundisolibacteraceae bacterium]
MNSSSKSRKKLTLSVTDQAPIHDNGSSSQALNHSVELAKLCDQLGYHRYWFAEHHNSPGYACPAPEILIAHVAQNTTRIRVGSGGVMLTHYSPTKVAETFRMLSALNPGRIDLSIGRAPGGDRLATQALGWPRQPIASDLYPQQAATLMSMLHDELPADHPFAQVKVIPEDAQAPQTWMLGSSGGSAELAGQLGYGFVLALFINTHERSPEILDNYRAAFKPNAGRQQPEAMLGAAVICAPSREQAETIARTRTIWIHTALSQGKIINLPSPEQAEQLYEQLNEQEKARYGKVLGNTIIGTPADCREKLEAQAAQYQVDEISVVCVTYHLKDRLRSYRLLAEEFGMG